MGTKKNMSPVEFSKFLDELEKEYHHYVNQGTQEKAQIADISMQVAQKTGDLLPFYDRKKAKQVVMDTFPNLPEDNAEDVGEMLHLVIKDLTKEEVEPEKEEETGSQSDKDL